MSVWTLHFLNARLELTSVLSDLRAAGRQAVALASPYVDLPDFDLVVRAQTDRSADGSIQGRCPAPGVIEMAVTPDRFDPAAFARALVRQLAHLVRRDGPGHGLSLGEVMVSEGLAGHFVLQVMGGQTDALDAVRCAPGTLRQAMNEWARRDYDHARWFDGKGDLRRGTGQSLGHRLIAGHLAQNPGDSAASLVTAPAEPFRQALRRIAAQEGQSEGDESSEG